MLTDSSTALGWRIARKYASSGDSAGSRYLSRAIYFSSPYYWTNLQVWCTLCHPLSRYPRPRIAGALSLWYARALA